MSELDAHYKVGGIQPIEYMKCKMSKEQYEGFCLGNVIKYISRCDFKGSKLDDLRKARQYFEWLMESVESVNEPSQNTKLAPNIFTK